MFKLLAVLLAVLVTFASAESVIVDFGILGEVTVSQPPPRGANPPYLHEATVMSPTKKAAALKFCLNISVMGPPLCEVVLARPGKPAITLTNGVVGQLLWSEDGRYLVGEGTNTLRIWNLSGGGRLFQPRTGAIETGPQSVPRIIQTRFERGNLCVLVHEDWYAPDASGQVKRVSDTLLRYAVPSLRLIESRPASGLGPVGKPCNVW